MTIFVLCRIALLHASRGGVYVTFWFVLDNPCKDNVNEVKELANESNAKQLIVIGG
jgi:hypothetical protein